MIQRRRIYEKAAPSRDAQKIYVFCEGDERETEYFEFFEGMSSNLEIIPIPPHDHRSSPNNLLAHADRLFFGESPKYELDYDQHDMVWFVIDTDQWMESGQIGELRAYCSERNKGIRYSSWQVAQSNPSFEIWLYYHIYRQPPLEDDLKCHSSFKEYVNAMITGGFDSRTMPIHIEEAIENSKSNFAVDKDLRPTLFSTEVHRLGEDIVKYTFRELQIKKRTLV